jgi:ribosome-associated heat shock protein Hsp15
MQTAVRIDKWLWAVRLYRTRSAAIEACRAGHIKIEGRSVKPARDIQVGEVVVAQVGPIQRTVRVIGLIDRRVGASQVPQLLEDLTPAEEYAKRREPELKAGPVWERGQGRPTKRNRRLLDRFKGAT